VRAGTLTPPSRYPEADTKRQLTVTTGEVVPGWVCPPCENVG